MGLIEILLSSSFLFAHDVAAGMQSIKSNSNESLRINSPIELGKCKPQTLNAKGGEEFFVQKETEKADLSKEEILARLIFSESLSTGFWAGKCQANSGEDIMYGVGWGVMNRVSVKLKNSIQAYNDVVFAKNQFRTSFSSKRENIFAISFMCPLKAQKYLDLQSRKVLATILYEKAQKIAQNIIEQYEREGIPAQYKGITNFFYPYSEFFGDFRPSWAKNEIAEKNKGYKNILNVSGSPCVEFYKL